MNSIANPEIKKKTAFWRIGIGISALLVVLPPMIGGVVTVLGMKNAFADMSHSGIGDPAALSGHISNVLQATLWGMIVSSAGVVCLVISIVRFLQFRSLLKNATEHLRSGKPTRTDITAFVSFSQRIGSTGLNRLG